MILTKKNILFFIIGIIFASCGAQNHKIAVIKYTDVYLRYVAEKRELQTEVKIIADTGSVLIRDSFFFSQKGAEAEKLLPQKYKNEYKYKLVRENLGFNPPFLIQFPFNNQTVKHSLACPNINNLRLATDFLNTADGGLLIWEGQTFGELDAVRIIITDSKAQTYSLNHVGKTRSNQLTLPKTELQNLAKGNAVLNLSFQHNEIQKTENQEIRKTVEFYCTTLTIEIK